ncbi:MAG TPA: TonB family protein [Vicinamibacterales bacterium]|nr:TonB family protein [Vicinamibacterales bacterium]
MYTPRVRAAIFVTAACLLLPSGPSAQSADSYKIIVNPANPVAALSKSQLSNIFLRKTTTWDSGQPVQPIDQVETSALRELFSKEVLGLPPATAARQAGAASNGEPLLTVASDREVLAYVRLKPGGVGYVSAAAPTQGLKVLTFGRSGDIASTSQGPEAIRVGGAVPMPTRVFSRPPVYPPAAKIAKVEGTVELELLIGATGAVEDVSVVKPAAMLTDAAVSAVRHWKYAPTVVNGTAVPVRMTTQVTFTLR